MLIIGFHLSFIHNRNAAMVCGELIALNLMLSCYELSIISLKWILSSLNLLLMNSYLQIQFVYEVKGLWLPTTCIYRDRYQLCFEGSQVLMGSVNLAHELTAKCRYKFDKKDIFSYLTKECETNFSMPIILWHPL